MGRPLHRSRKLKVVALVVLYGTDVSHYEGELDWDAVASGGAVMATYKATEGVSYVDPEFGYNHVATLAAGLISGPYHFLRREWSGVAQADHFLDVVGDLTGRLAQLDVETSGTKTNPTVTQVRDFVARFRARTNNHPIILYLPKWWYDLYGGGADLSGLGPLWASHYVTNRTGTAQEQYARASSSWATAGYAGWDSPSLLQFTDNATIGGQPVMDADVFLGSPDDLKALCYPPDLQPVSYTEDDDMGPFGMLGDVGERNAVLVSLPVGQFKTVGLDGEFGSTVVRVAVRRPAGWQIDGTKSGLPDDPRDAKGYVTVSSGTNQVVVPLPADAQRISMTVISETANDGHPLTLASYQVS